MYWFDYEVDHPYVVANHFMVFSNCKHTRERVFSRIFTRSSMRIVYVFVVAVIYVRFTRIYSILNVVRLDVVIANVDWENTVIWNPLS